MESCGVMLACVLMLSCVASVPKPTAHTHAQCPGPETIHPVTHLEPTPPSDGFPTLPSALTHRLRRSPKQRTFFGSKRKANRPDGEKDRGRACGLRRVQLKVSDLGLGYHSQEELIFSYCSGVCANALTNYDKILRSLRRDVLRSSPPKACCRPLEYDRRLSFLDDQLVYHTMERHSARRCGCV